MTKRTRLFLAGLTLAIAAGTSLFLAPATPPAKAGSGNHNGHPVVVELFTSQGCHSCPPADKYVGELKKHENVIALAYHVDYWDYIGWKDVFGRAEHTARQKAYATFAGRRSIYTPQMVVGGVHDVVGTHPKDVEDVIRRHRALPQLIELDADRATDTLRIVAKAQAAFAPPLEVQVVQFMRQGHVEITRGENAGRMLDYANVVTGWSKIGSWDGKSPLQVTAPVAADQSAVVILQRPGPGKIEAAVLAD